MKAKDILSLTVDSAYPPGFDAFAEKGHPPHLVCTLCKAHLEYDPYWRGNQDHELGDCIQNLFNRVEQLEATK